MKKQTNDDIAIVGMGCRFPGGANSPEKLWEVLAEGRDCFIDVPKDRWDMRKFYDPDPDKPGKISIKQAGFLQENIRAFDPGFFGMSPREAETLDPQQRLILEVGWEAMEDSGMPLEHFQKEVTGVFMGGFHMENYSRNMDVNNTMEINKHSAINIMATMLSNKFSFLFDLSGPSLSVDTACSSSLTALQIAISNLRNGQCDLALVGGANAMIVANSMVTMSKGRFFSERSRAFGINAKGYGRGEGAGVVVLKSLSKALENKDKIYSIVKNIGLNQDGKTPGITLPSQEAQAKLMEKVYKESKVNPSEIQYFEAHGTGTDAGDKAESWSINKVLSKGRKKGEKVNVGSIKTNIGHTEAVAGIAGVIKASLVLDKQQIPPSLHSSKLNPKIPFEDMNINIPQKLIPLLFSESKPVYAAVNSFGFGGANAHALLQSAPIVNIQKKESHSLENSSSLFLVPFSGRDDKALKSLASRYSLFLEGSNKKLEDFCYSTIYRRTHHNVRGVVIAKSKKHLEEELKLYSEGVESAHTISGQRNPEKPKVLFVFPGVGPQWFAMGRELWKTQPVYKKALLECDKYFKKVAKYSIIKELLKDKETSRINQTEYLQPAIAAVQISLTQLWKSWGIEPDTIIGHSLGEIAAAWSAEVITLETAMKIAACRGSILKKLASRGKMLAVGLSDKDIQKYIKNLTHKVSVAASNDAQSCTLSGEEEALETIAESLEEEAIFCRFLRVDVPYHSPLTEEVIPEFKEELGEIKVKQPSIELYSSLLGKKVNKEKLNLDYWCRNIRQPVQFYKTLSAVAKRSDYVVIEIGPHPVLKNSITSIFTSQNKTVKVFASLLREQPENLQMLSTLAELFTVGVELKWKSVSPVDGEYIKLPTYPWQREVYWSESEESIKERLGSPDASPFLQKRLDTPQPTWTSEINELYFPFLKEHVVNGKVVFPGAGYINIAQAMQKELFGENIFAINNIEFESMLAVDNEDVMGMQISYDSRSNDFSLYSRSQIEKGQWVLNAKGTIVTGYKDLLINNGELKAIERRCLHRLEGEEIYTELEGRGLLYGEFFRPIQSIQYSKKEALVCLEYPLDEGKGREFMISSLFDGVFQSSISLVDQDIKGLFVPKKVNKILFLKELSQKVFAHVSINWKTSEGMEVDVTVYNDAGETLTLLKGVYLVAIPTLIDDNKEKVGLYRYSFKKWESKNPREGIERVKDWVVLKTPFSQFESDKILLEKGCRSITLTEDNLTPLKDYSKEFEKHGHASTVVLNLDLSFSEDKDFVQELAGLNKFLLALSAMLSEGEGEFNFYVTTRGDVGVLEEEPVSELGLRSPIVWALASMIKVVCVERPSLNMLLHIYSDGGMNIEALYEHSLLGSRIAINYYNNLYVENLDSYSGVLKDRTVSPDKHCIQPYSPDKTIGGMTFKVSPIVEPKNDEIQIKISHTALNFKDLLKITGRLPSLYMKNSFTGSTIGLECAGQIIKKGEMVTEYAVGDEVVVAFSSHSFSSWLTIKPLFVQKKIPNISLSKNIQYMPFVAVYYGLIYKANLRGKEKVLIHNATGAVGLAAIQVAKWVGAEVYTTVGSLEKREYLQAMGITNIYDSRSLNFGEEIKELDVVIGAVQDNSLQEGLKLLKSGGRYVELGKKNILDNSGLPMESFDRNLSFIGVDVDNLAQDDSPVWSEVLEKVHEGFKSGYFKPLPTKVFSVKKIKEAFQFMAQGRHIGRVIVDWEKQKLPVKSQLCGDMIKPNKTYIVTGGLGGFGLEVAKWLVKNGGEYIVLVGRRGVPSPEAKEAILWMEEYGAQVMPMAVDVSDKKRVNEMVSSIQDTFPEIKGVIHSAMVLDDKLITEMDQKSLERVFDPKIGGVINLHQATLNCSLDLFVCFSSITSVLGNKGQANYAAANGFLDGFAVYRQAMGLPATTINWGALGETGIVARNKDVEKILELSGIRSISIKEALKALEIALLSNETNMSVFDVDWKQWTMMNPQKKKSPFLSNILSSYGEAESSPMSQFISEMKKDEDNGGNKTQYSLKRLTKELSLVLKMKEESVNVESSLSNMGVDSLMGVEFAANVQKKIGAEVSTFDIMKGISLKQLAEKVMNQVEKEKMN